MSHLLIVIQGVMLSVAFSYCNTERHYAVPHFLIAIQIILSRLSYAFSFLILSVNMLSLIYYCYTECQHVESHLLLLH